MLSDSQKKAPTLQGRGWGGALPSKNLALSCADSPHPNPSPKEEGLNA